MGSYRLRVVSLALVLLVLFGNRMAFAQAVPVSSMQNALSGVVQSKMTSRGFSANDPRFINTLSGAGAAIAGAAAGAAVVTMAGVTAPAWVTAAAATGLSILFAEGISLAADKVAKWITPGDGTIKTDAPPQQTPAGLAPSTLYCLNSTCASTASGACSAAPDTVSGTIRTNYEWGAGGLAGCRAIQSHATTGAMYGDAGSVGIGQFGGKCAGIGLTASNGACPASNFPAVVQSFPNASAAAGSVPPAETVKPANPQLIAALANEAWQAAAAAPGYAGLPYDAANPITEADAATWQASNPSAWPKVADLLAPQPAPSGGTAATPFTLPTSTAPVTSQPATQPSPGVNPSTEPIANLGDDPGIGAPSLEAIPTAAQILEPIFSLLPSLRTYAVPEHTATCPTATLNMFNSTQAFNAHCDLLEQVRVIVAACMAAVWAFCALRVTLSA